MNIDAAQISDGEALVKLYRSNHLLGAGRLRLEPDQEARTLVATIDDRIVGMALVTYFNDGLHRYGILHVLEVDDPRADYASETANALVGTSRAWLQERGTTHLLAAPQIDAWLIVDQIKTLRAIAQHLFRSQDPPESIMVPRQTWA